MELAGQNGDKRGGRVFLIGAGPGDPELLTLKAARALALADVVLVDDLVNRAVLVHVSRQHAWLRWGSVADAARHLWPS